MWSMHCVNTTDTTEPLQANPRGTAMVEFFTWIHQDFLIKLGSKIKRIKWKLHFPCINYTFGNVWIMAKLKRLIKIIYHTRFCCSYKVCNNEPAPKTNIKEVYILIIKTPRKKNLGIITSLISLPISLMLVFPTLCLNLFLTCRPPILLLPSGL